MKYIFKNLTPEASFKEFQEEHLRVFGDDYFVCEEDVPEGKIKEANDEFLRVEHDHIAMWIDDNSNDEIYV